jgi:CRISPR/Cas system CMR-associated protein Cmr5 small subunit
MSHLINIEQIRAKNALGKTAQEAKAKKENGEGDNLSGYPSLIINNGLIATIAFSIDKGKQHQRIAHALAFHLNERGIISAKDATGLRDALCMGNAATLQRATHEALQFLSYLKRFQRG